MGRIAPVRRLLPLVALFASLTFYSPGGETSWGAARQDFRYDGLAPGKFLIAPREPLDPAFAATVVLLISYDENGAVGLVINRPTDVPISRALESLKRAKKVAGHVFLGGPVQPDVVLALYRAAAKTSKSAPLFGDVHLASARPALERALSSKPSDRTLRVYLGYTGWAPGQLEHEMDLDVWRVLPADAQSVFDADPSSVWPRLIAKTEMRLARSIR